MCSFNNVNFDILTTNADLKPQIEKLMDYSYVGGFTDADGFILELRIGIDEDGETYKHFNQYDSAEELDEFREEESDEIPENTLLN